MLARWQFGLTIGFHFIFVPLTIGLSWALLVMESLGCLPLWGWKRDAAWISLSKLFGKLLAVTFGVGVATGIVMEFQFGTNWAEYSKFVGDVFGAPLAIEGIFAFFLESVFLGVYLFGRDRVPRWLHWFASLMVAVGATLSAFWILVANSWQQTPAGYTVKNGRAVLTNFGQAVFNPSTMPRFLHTLDAALTAGIFLVIGVAAYMLLRNLQVDAAKRALKLFFPLGLVVTILNVVPLGHLHGRQVAKTQPAKLAAIEGLYVSRTAAPLVIFAIPDATIPALNAKLEIPGLLSWVVFGDINATVHGLNEFPKDEIPPLWLSFVAFHNMVALGGLFILICAWGTFQALRGKLWTNRWFLKLLPWFIALPIAACEFGWTAAEVGRQPWVVYGLQKTRDAVSITNGPTQILISMILLCSLYLILFFVWLYLSVRVVRDNGPATHVPEEGRSWT